MLELAMEVTMRTPVELLLVDAIDREWEVQSSREAPLECDTPLVRQILELVLAGTPSGIFGVIALHDSRAATPDELVAELGDLLPVELSEWRSRSLRRAGALRGPELVLPAGRAPLLLPAAPSRSAEPLAPRPEPRPEPEPEPARGSARHSQPAPPDVHEPAPAPANERRPRVAARAAAGMAAGAGIGAADALLQVPAVALGAGAGLAAATVAVLAGARH